MFARNSYWHPNVQEYLIKNINIWQNKRNSKKEQQKIGLMNN